MTWIQFLWRNVVDGQGTSNIPGSKTTTLAHIKAMSNFKNRDEQVNPRILAYEEVPGAKPLLEKLQYSVSIESASYSAMSKLPSKKQYSEKKRNFKKRMRNDKKYKA